jgi:hypothetical protein
MTEQAEEATRLSAAFAQAAKAWKSLSTALSGEIALKNEALAARETEIARLHQRIAEMDARARAAMGRETALQQQLAALYSSTSWRIAAPLRFAKHLLAHFPTLNNSLRAVVHVRSAKHFGVPPLLPVSGALVDPQKTELLSDQLDLNAEPDNVRRLYLRLVRTRERIRRNSIPG